MILQKTTNKGLSLGIACNSCSTKGQLTLLMNLANLNGKKKFSASISPKSFVADLPLTFTASGTLLGSWDKTFNILPTLALPGFSIPGLFTLGPNLQIEAGFSLSDVTGNIELHSGVEMRLPDSATATADFSNLKKGKISGWKPSFKAKKFSVGSAEVSALIDFRTVIKVAITGKVLGDGVEVDVQLAIPTVNVKISAKHG
ncbi:hypothetical protein B0O99DRAFT_137808 [Bisporella sp. PMI_857]|nr:hypothetical protein B0O99DRAFT_137808 [Bisporella sp. PMI_857]